MLFKSYNNLSDGLKKKKQIAALPVKYTRKGKIRVLMVTSRETRRWVVPKGWPMDGKKPWKAAAIEAMEEAGAIGDISKERYGTFDYYKRLNDGTRIKCRVSLYPMVVRKLKKNWPERHERTRRWFTLREASKRVREPELKSIFKNLRKQAKRDRAQQNYRIAS
jgi:8-oxo-dGTP pyrophosphatase MutT (NUDIX family)